MEPGETTARATPLQRWHINQARRALDQGGVIAYPTEAVMGLGCNPWNEAAVAKVLRLKRRPADKGLIVIASSIRQLSALVEFSMIAQQQDIIGSWPGHVTWLVPAKAVTPSWLTGQHETLAVRVSAHPVVQMLCNKVGALVSTSANPSGCRPAGTQRRVRAYFGRDVDCYVPGKVGNDPRPSKIRDALTGRLIRA